MGFFSLRIKPFDHFFIPVEFPPAPRKSFRERPPPPKNWSEVYTWVCTCSLAQSLSYSKTFECSGFQYNWHRGDQVILGHGKDRCRHVLLMGSKRKRDLPLLPDFYRQQLSVPVRSHCTAANNSRTSFFNHLTHGFQISPAIRGKPC